MRWKLALVLVITLACLVWVLWGIDPATVEVSVTSFRWERMLVVFALYLASHGVRVVRLRWILGRPIPFWPLMSIVSIGYVAINVVPLRMGELVRPYMLRERYEVPFGAGMAAVFVERLVDMLMLLGMLALVAFWVDLPEGRVLVQGVDVLAFGQRFAGGIVAVGTIGVITLAVAGDPLLRLTDRLPLGGMIRRFGEGLRSLVARPRELVQILLASVLIWLLTLWSVQVSLSAFPGLPWDFQSALLVWTVTLLGMAAIPTPGFFGGFEAACVAGLTLLRVGPDEARTFAVILHLGQFGFTVAWGLLFLFWEGLSLRQVVSQSRAALDREGPGGR